MKIKKVIISRIGLFVLLYAVFFSYRLYFWGEPSKHIYQVLLNALGDTVISYGCGFLIYNLKLRFSGNKKLFYALSVLSILIGIAFVYFIHVFVYRLFHMLSSDFLGLFNAICFQLLDSVAIVISGALAVMIENMNHERDRITQTLYQLNQEKLQSEIKYLKARMDPHFVFNSLNTIFYQINDADKEAKESLVQFSDILRYHLLNSGLDKVYLNDEIKYMKAYIDFQSKRTKDFIAVKSSFEIEENEFLIEPLLLMPLIENAFKFVCTEDKHSGWIEIAASFKQNKFEFNIRNSFDPVAIKLCNGAQMGLQNVLKRLSLLYQSTHDFKVENSNNAGVYSCNLILWK